MKGTYLGEFEELVLLSIGVLKEEAYGVAIKDFIEDKTGRKSSIGALHSALSRLDDKGYVSTYVGKATKIRGGRRKKFYKITIGGQTALTKVNEQRNDLYEMIPRLNFAY